MEKNVSSPLRCTELLQRFEEKEALTMGEELRFLGVDGRDVYNITAPFEISFGIGHDERIITVIAGRVEKRGDKAKSQIVFFEENEKGEWTPVAGAQPFPLEDGFVTRIKDEIIFGGVSAYPQPTETDPNNVGYKTVFYRGTNLSSLKENQFATGPEKMKDIRLVGPLKNGKIGVFTRPQGDIGGKGKIGYLEIDRLEDLDNPEIMKNAKIIENQFATGEWGGANDLHLLSDGRIEVIGHIAYQDEPDTEGKEGAKHYYAMSFIYDPSNHTATPIEIIATIKNFPEGEAKTPQHKDVIFPSSLLRHGDGTGTLYVGLGDARAGKLERPAPLTKN